MTDIAELVRRLREVENFALGTDTLKRRCYDAADSLAVQVAELREAIKAAHKVADMGSWT